MTFLITDLYTDIAAADAYLVLNDDWLQLDDETKNHALMQAKYFIDENFDICDKDSFNQSDLTTIPDELQLSSSLLAYDSINNDLFKRHTVKPVKEQSVKAGSVSSSKKFVISNNHLLPPSFSRVKVILSTLYNEIGNINFLIRA